MKDRRARETCKAADPRIQPHILSCRSARVDLQRTIHMNRQLSLGGRRGYAVVSPNAEPQTRIDSSCALMLLTWVSVHWSSRDGSAAFLQICMATSKHDPETIWDSAPYSTIPLGLLPNYGARADNPRGASARTATRDTICHGRVIWSRLGHLQSRSDSGKGQEGSKNSPAGYH
ncbi:hypothetical protein B0H21DRAFT_332359 [Amylocystis lapponica]|nr:hypothetical protein B0H21DRAFT_332359 [Amylocystis lapponica]